MTTIRLVRFAEHLFNTHGDVENVRPLALRASARGHSTEVVAYSGGRWSGQAPSVVVIGSAMEFQFDQALDTLRAQWPRIGEWQASGTIVLAVGTGMEMLGHQIQRGSETVEGLGVHAGRALSLNAHQSRFVTVSHDAGEAVGFVNRDRRMEWSGNAPVGTIATPHDLSSDHDLFLSHQLVMTALRGPVLATNPWIADWILHSCGVDTKAPLPEALVRLDAHSTAVANRIRHQASH